MPVADKIIDLFEALRTTDLDQLSPVMRQRFAQMCMYWAAKADPPKPAVTTQTPKTNGVLASLANGERAL